MRLSASTRLPAIRISSWNLQGSFGAATRSCMTGLLPSCCSGHAVQGKVEGIKIAQGPAGRNGKPAVRQHGHPLFRQTPMRAQRLVEAREVVQLRRRTQGFMSAGDDDNVADAI